MVTARPNPRAAQLQPATRRQPRRPTRRMPSPEEVALAETVGAKLTHCDKHAIDYYTFEAQLIVCPACDLESRVTQLEIDLKAARNAVDRLVNERDQAQKLVNMVAAMRDAVFLMDADDLVWVKAVVYRWRMDRSIKLKPLHDTKHEHPTGLMAVPTKGDPEARTCTSIGGVALAGFIEESNQSQGAEDTMSSLARAMHRHLQGGI